MAKAGSRKVTDDQHRAVAEEMYARWEAGESKSSLELEYWNRPQSHGKAFSAYMRKWLGRETEKSSSQSEHVQRLEALLRAHGVSPTDAGDLDEEFRLLAKARESALAAVRVYNDPLAGFRTETFIVLMVIAWNALLQAMLERDGIDYYERDPDGKQILRGGRPSVIETWELVKLALPGAKRHAMRCNLDFFLGLRNCIAHRYLPAVDLQVVSESQAMLLNFESVLTSEFGPEAALGDCLCVPLQLSGFRNDGTVKPLKKAQAQLPPDVQSFLNQHRQNVSDKVLNSPEYALQIFFVPVTANRERSADAQVQFVPMGKVTSELEKALNSIAVVTKRKQVAVASHDLLRPSEVVEQVRERLSHRFTTDTHQRAWKYYKVRPATGSAEPEATDDKYCVWDRLMRQYGYTQAWVDLLVKDLSKPKKYEEVVGFRPGVQ